MFKKITSFFLVLGVTLGLGLMMPAGAHAASVLADQCKDNPDTSICKQDASPGDLIKLIVNVLLFIVGAISVVMIIVGGIFYATSAGDSGRVTTAKNTLFYAIIGLAVSFLAYAIVNWVLKQFIK